MSNKLRKKKAKPLEVDTNIVYDGDQPMAIIPISERAVSLFHRWGMDPDVHGITPPEDAMDLISSMPTEWVCGIDDMEGKEGYLIQEIPLPQPLIVLQ